MVIDTDAEKSRLYLLQWLKSDRALMMLFNDGTFQVIKETFLAYSSFIHWCPGSNSFPQVCGIKSLQRYSQPFLRNLRIVSRFLIMRKWFISPTITVFSNSPSFTKKIFI